MESRLADQISMAMACFFIYLKQDKMTKEEFNILVKEYNLTEFEYTEQNEIKEHEAAYENLMEIILDNYTQTTVAQAIHNLIYSDNEEYIYDKMLGTHGLRFYKKEKELFIQNNNGNLKKKLNKYPDLNRVLKRDEEI